MCALVGALGYALLVVCCWGGLLLVSIGWL